MPVGRSWVAAAGRSAGRRAGEGVAVLLVVSLLTFGLLTVAAGDAATAIVLAREGTVTAGTVARVRAELGLDLPAPVRYLHGLTGLLTGDLGASARTGRDVAGEVATRLGPTITLATAGAVVAVVLGLGAGVLAAGTRRRVVRLPIRLGSLGLLSVPAFALAQLGVLLFALQWRLLPTQGIAGWPSLVLPAAVIGLPLAAVLAQVTEARLRSTLREPFVTTARARGTSPVRVLLATALPNAAAPLLVVVGDVVGSALAATVVAETAFGWPGIGDYLVRALQFRDWYPLQAAVLLVAVGAVSARGLAGSLAAVVDARAGVRS
ncbi:ABC transporter permease [Modestobacter roseus]|uniref:Peptide/nickel transport system permease protein n=1 Tax=Modestobacter roseus TaxID=1181884 RepID=A0A562IR06_9ACTN|nr:ABC transporter permease [Modestobacter roseus]MQA34690.1 ABC transporter permease subunit [Modestobacter roseus]TWH73165.1 peptide/nickel transport system permease protein [Modestobacter roseus]